ncbi:MAG: hypothetical protein GC156_16220 [Actinomycetales bacterium]|nr:hypothetical protein [Actinomycetales bacterium]
MTGPYATLVIAVSLLLAAWALVQLLVNRPPGPPLWFALGFLELLLLVFLVGGIVQMFGSDRDFARVEFVLYLLGLVALVPLASWWVRDEKSRAAAGVLLVVLLVVPVMIVRVQQVWAGPNG